MKTSQEWFNYFKLNLQQERIDWSQLPKITLQERAAIVKSLQAWQLGETSDGKNLIRAASKYADKINDPFYVKSIELFIKEEQKHGNNLGKYLDAICAKRIKKNWGDTLFRKARHFNTSMELWTLPVITVESAAQVFYQALKDATECNLLKQICTDILIDEAAHIQFQQERMAAIYRMKGRASRFCSYYCYKYFYFTTSLVVWMAHKKLFKAGNVDFTKYRKKMGYKFEKTIGKLRYETKEYYSFQTC
ncbi:ferritin-like domain-containing protein [Chitinophagaceae bacterium LWZ2-11]